MTTLAEYMIVVGAENHPLMFDKTMYNSWESRMLLYIKGKKNGRMMLESIEKGPLVYPTIEEESAKDIWERVKLLMKGTELSYQERECKLYNEFDKFTSVKGETLDEYYLCFAQLINDMHTISMTIQQVQVNTKFLNALPPEWSKFVTDVKLAKNMYTTNYDQLYAYLSQHKGHANEVRMMGLAVPVFLLGDDPIACLKKAMEFTSTVVASHFPSTNNQLRTSSNPRNQATIQDGRVTVQQVQGRQGQSFAGMEIKGNATSSGGNNEAGHARVVKCYNSHDHGIAYCHDIQPTIIHDAAFQTDDLDAYDSDCDDISSTKAVLMANLSSYDSDVLSEVVKVRTTPDAITKGSWGFEHTKKVFLGEVIPVINSLRASLKDFDNGLHSELNEVQRTLDSDLDSACKYAKRIKEVLVYVTTTCPSLAKLSEKLVAVTPLNKNKKVRFTEPATSSSNTQQQVDSHKIQDSNKHVLPSTRMKSSTSASRSQPSSNTKNNRISQPTSSKLKNKVEVQPRSVKSNSNKKNDVVEHVCNADVKHTKLNANSELIYVKCNQCMFDANHDVCFHEYVNDMNILSKSKSAKRSKRKQTWKPTGKVFTDIGYKWKLTGRTFTIVGNSCPLTRFTSTKIEPLKETTLKSVTTSNPKIKIYRRKTKVAKSVDLNSELRILGSRPTNISKPNKHYGSTVSNSPSSSLVNFRLSRLFSGI
ncbi:hypothetical protein Tco_1026047 [Tanacetum coccineum]